MDELRNAIREKTDRSLDRMVRATNPPFTMAFLECLVQSKFRLPQLEPFDELKDLQDYLSTFKTTLGLQQPSYKILCRSFPHHSQRSRKGVVHKVTNIIHRQLQEVEQCLFAPLRRGTTLEEASKPFTHHQKTGEKNLEILCKMLYSGNSGGGRS